MEPCQLLRKNIAEKVALTDEEFSALRHYFKEVKVKKKKDLLRVGEVCRQLAFVTKGALRSYTIDEQGYEKVVLIALENYWIGDLMSFITGNPSSTAIEAMEDTELLVISNFDLERIYLEVPKMERFFRKLFEKAYINALGRYNSVVSDAAEIRYQNLFVSHPDIMQRIPLIYIASYLGVTPETLSRLRKKAMETK